MAERCIHGIKVMLGLEGDDTTGLPVGDKLEAALVAAIARSANASHEAAADVSTLNDNARSFQETDM